MHPLRFGILTIDNGAWQPLAADWCHFEALGFDSLWLADHHAVPSTPTLPLLDTWTLLGVLATQTSRIRLGTLVTNVARRPPALLAKEILTVDHLPGGRLDVGLGPGYYPEEHRWVGVEFPALDQRIARFGEAVTALDLLLRQERTTFPGTFYRLENTPMYPPPVQHPRPPFVLGTMHPQMVRLVAALADGWNPLVKRHMTSEEALVLIQERSQLLAEYCAEIGRDPATIARSYLVGWANETPFVSKEVFTDFIERYRAVGINEFIFYSLNEELAVDPLFGKLRGRWADRASLERVATEYLPALRAVGEGSG